MKLTILIDNYTISGGCYGAESGFSAWFEDRGKTVLLDTGRSDMFMKNAWRRGIDCLQAVFKVCTYASDYTYGGIRPHVYTHQVTRIYVSSYTYVRMSLHVYMSLCQAPSYPVPGFD